MAPDKAYRKANCTNAGRYNLYDLIESKIERDGHLIKSVTYQIKVRSIADKKSISYLDNQIKIDGKGIIGSTIQPWLEVSYNEDFVLIYISFECERGPNSTKIYNSVNLISLNTDNSNKPELIYSDIYRSDTSGKFMAVEHIDNESDRIYHMYDKKLGVVKVDGSELKFESRSTSLNLSGKQVYLIVKRGVVGISSNHSGLVVYRSQISGDSIHLKKLAESEICETDAQYDMSYGNSSELLIVTQGDSLHLEIFGKKKGGYRRIDYRSYDSERAEPHGLNAMITTSHQYLVSYVSNGYPYYLYRNLNGTHNEWERTLVQIKSDPYVYHSVMCAPNKQIKIIYSLENFPKHSIHIVPNCDSGSDIDTSHLDTSHLDTSYLDSSCGDTPNIRCSDCHNTNELQIKFNWLWIILSTIFVLPLCYYLMPILLSLIYYMIFILYSIVWYGGYLMISSFYSILSYGCYGAYYLLFGSTQTPAVQSNGFSVYRVLTEGPSAMY